jgi:hypothetical protein
MKKIVLFATVLWLVSGGAGLAQLGSGTTPGINASLAKLFGNITAFSAKCDLRMLDAAQKEKMALPMDFAMLDGKFRAEIDLSQMKGQELEAGAAAQMKQMGMGHIISLMHPDKKAVYLVYPELQSYIHMPLPKEAAAALDQDPKIERTVLGKETLDGQVCEKVKVILTDAQGQQAEALVWAAKDLKDFPIQIQMKEKGDTVILRYKNVKLAKPGADQFELPSNFTAYQDMQSFMAGVMQKMMGGLGQP